ncbi:YadA-like family protein [Enterobacter cloacae]
MNKIYRLIWDADRGMLIPVSELTVSKGKSHRVCGAVVSCGVFKLFRLSAISSAFLMLSELGGISPAFAAYTAGGGVLCTTSDVTAGICVQEGGDRTMVIGGSSIGGFNSTVIGNNSQAYNSDTTIVGWRINSDSHNSTVIGNDLKVINSEDAVTIGAGWDSAGNIGNMGKNGIYNSRYAASVGSVNTIENSEYAVNLGARSLISNADKAIALGGNVTVTADGAMALGYGAKASDIDSIAIGVGSKTDSIIKTPEIVIRGQTFTMAGGNPTSTMSIGNTDTGITRTITSLAAGRVNASSTDAINGSQLYAFQNAMDQLVLDNSFNFLDNDGDGVSIKNGGSLQFKTPNNNIQIDEKGVTDAGILEVALNNNLDLTDSGSIKTGDSIVNNDGLTIANGPSITTGGIDAGGKVIGNVAPGVAGTDAVNKDQLDGVATVANAGWNVTDAAGNAANIGPAGEVKFTSADSNLAVAQTGSEDAGVINLTLNRDLAVDSVTAGNSVLNTDGLTIANGPSITTGGIDAGGKVIGNVAPGVAGTDAVNVDQMTSLGGDLTAKGLNLAGNTGSGHLNLGETLSVLGGGSTAGSYSGSNIRTNVDSYGHLHIEIAESPKFGNITINDGNRITGLADGQNLDDAVNLGQLNEVAANAGGNWNIRDANDLGYAASYAVNSGDTVTFASADENPTDLSGNLTVQHENGTVTYDLNEDLVLSSVTTGQTVLANDGLKVGSNVMLGNTGLVINGGPSITINGIDAGGKKITNVAAGTDATDAVNVSQLKDYGDVIINNIYNTGMKYFHTNSTLADSEATGTDSVAVGPNAVASGENSIASGNGAISSGSGALANGHNAEATGNASVSIGENSSSKAENSVALGSGAVVTESGKNSVALGAGSIADRENTVSVGSEGSERQITNVAAGEKDTDAVNVGQLNGVHDEITNIGGTITNITEGKDGMFQVNNTSNNSRPVPTGKDSLAGGAGAKASGNNSMAVGTNSSASGENSVALGNGSSSKSKNSVSLGANSIADRDNSVSVGSIGAERQITNVAAGEAPTDAVNVSQLNDAVGTINQNTNNKFGQLKNMVEKQGRKMSAGVAGAMAMAGLPQPYSPGASMVALGAGTFQGESAVALGVSVISDNGKWVTKLSGSSSSQGDYGVNVGVGYQW